MAEWAKISVGLFRDEAIASLGDRDVVAFLRLVLWAQEKETDGHVPARALRAAGVASRSAKVLADEGLLEPNGDGWWIRGFLKHQRSKADLEREREAARERGVRRRNAREVKP